MDLHSTWWHHLLTGCRQSTTGSLSIGFSEPTWATAGVLPHLGHGIWYKHVWCHMCIHTCTSISISIYTHTYIYTHTDIFIILKLLYTQMGLCSWGYNREKRKKLGYGIPIPMVIMYLQLELPPFITWAFSSFPPLMWQFHIFQATKIMAMKNFPAI